ncbi:hypothetical protein G3N96_28765 [Burkholderia sp. Se-20373]|uniref:hypothetical protein n=1 Tax=Burkholderia sp. Se-20373 TaxID=2703898 RepID=UPI001980314C|nr:hypothetical protein [Burkholderia sp. Se-20373]MBN3749385.1 hypothetical protein [Burkholderia sp. Se-20373]
MVVLLSWVRASRQAVARTGLNAVECGRIARPSRRVAALRAGSRNRHHLAILRHGAMRKNDASAAWPRRRQPRKPPGGSIHG